VSLLPVGFMSYVRDDDTYERGRLTELRTRLSGEVAAQRGEPFPIFQDREDISWGQQWQERIDSSLDSATFLIPIITPRFFRSEACRAELERFVKREQELRRGDLILPIYYIDTPELNDQNKRDSDALAEVIHSRQYWDWRPLRFKPFASEQVGETIAQMAAKVVISLERRTVSLTATPIIQTKHTPILATNESKETLRSSDVASSEKGWRVTRYLGLLAGLLGAAVAVLSQIPKMVDAAENVCLSLGICAKVTDCSDSSKLSVEELLRCSGRR
jgi:hypothetical protein